MKQLTDREQAIVMATIRIWNFNLKNGYVPDYELISNASELPMEAQREIRDLVQTSPSTRLQTEGVNDMTKKQKSEEEIIRGIGKINAMRVKNGLCRIEKQWTGCAHWLSVPSGDPCGYRQVSGSLFHSDEALIGFLEGLAYAMETHNNFTL